MSENGTNDRQEGLAGKSHDDGRLKFKRLKVENAGESASENANIKCSGNGEDCGCPAVAIWKERLQYIAAVYDKLDEKCNSLVQQVTGLTNAGVNVYPIRATQHASTQTDVTDRTYHASVGIYPIRATQHASTQTEITDQSNKLQTASQNPVGNLADDSDTSRYRTSGYGGVKRRVAHVVQRKIPAEECHALRTQNQHEQNAQTADAGLRTAVQKLPFDGGALMSAQNSSKRVCDLETQLSNTVTHKVRNLAIVEHEVPGPSSNQPVHGRTVKSTQSSMNDVNSPGETTSSFRTFQGKQSETSIMSHNIGAARLGIGKLSSTYTEAHVHPTPPVPSIPINQNLHPVSEKIPCTPELTVIPCEENGITLSWDMALTPTHAAIAKYRLDIYEEPSDPRGEAKWKRAGDIQAKNLPMTCTLTKFKKGHTYHLSLCAMDVHNRRGNFGTISTHIRM